MDQEQGSEKNREFGSQVRHCAAELGEGLIRLIREYGEVAMVVALLDELGGGLGHALKREIFNREVVLQLLDCLNANANLNDDSYDAVLKWTATLLDALREYPQPAKIRS